MFVLQLPATRNLFVLLLKWLNNKKSSHVNNILLLKKSHSRRSGRRFGPAVVPSLLPSLPRDIPPQPLTTSFQFLLPVCWLHLCLLNINHTHGRTRQFTHLQGGGGSKTVRETAKDYGGREEIGPRSHKGKPILPLDPIPTLPPLPLFLLSLSFLPVFQR